MKKTFSLPLRLSAAVLTLCLFLPLAGCAKKPENLMAAVTPQSISVLTPDEAFTAAQERLALGLIRQELKNHPAENVLVSPLSLTAVLGMLMNGAAGETRAQILRALSGDQSAEECNRMLAGILRTLQKSDEIHLSSAMFLNRSRKISVKRDFLQVNADYYNAPLQRLTFDAKGREIINQWVSKETNGKIDTLLEQLDPETLSVLISTLYLQSGWHEPFSAQETAKGSFTAADGTPRTVDMMHQRKVSCIVAQDYTGIRKELGASGLVFAALLPAEGQAPETVLQKLSEGTDLHKALTPDTRYEAEVFLPRFAVSYNTCLNEAVRSLGITDAFDAARADFSAAFDSRQPIDSILQKTTLTLDENGVIASAATAATTIGIAAPKQTTVLTVRFDRPFVYLIFDPATHAVLFAGVQNSIR